MIKIRYFNNGIFNQVLNLETLFGLDYRCPNQLHVSNFRLYIPLIRDNVVFNKFFKPEEFPIHMSDLFDFPDITFSTTVKDELKEFTSDHIGGYFSPGKDRQTLEDFAAGRTPIISGKDYSFSHSVSMYYSSFFHDRDTGLDSIFLQIKPKQEYVEFANLISKSLGSFVGAHIRLTDHRHVVDLNTYPVAEMLESLEGHQVVIATDDPGFSQIPKDAIIIEEFILNNFKKDFASLSAVGGDTLALIANLVLQNSVDFIGTKTSTFTGYIQRNIYQKNTEYRFKYFNNEFSSKPGDSGFEELPSSRIVI